jgi:replicative superfamily II helicase
MDDGHLLKQTIEYGIAFHHAKLPNIIKTNIEDLVSEGLIKVLCATTTLAQGMNFPITTVIFDTLNIGGGQSSRAITNSEFWNIAGRAGRAYMDKEGHIIIKMHSTQKETVEKTQSLIIDRTKEILSSLGKFFDELDEYRFDYKLIKDSPAAQNFLQYLNHILRVSYKYNLGNMDTTKIRNILDASLVFKESTYKEGFLEAQEKFSNFARSYIDNIKDKDTDRLKLADILGITNISLEVVTGLMLQHRKEMLEEYSEDFLEYVNATKIVLDSKSEEKLTPIISIINSIPEIKLALQGQGSFQPEQVAKLIISWVNGKHIKEIAHEVKYDNEDYDTVLDMCYKYINSNMTSYVPWGMSIYQQITNDKEHGAENLPSYIYYGVNNVESLIFSKIGIPRTLVKDMVNIYKAKHPEIPITIENIHEIKTSILNYSDGDFNILDKEASIIKNIVNKNIT